MGKLNVVGDFVDVWVEDSDQNPHEPGALPAGDYRVFVRYTSDGDAIPSSPITIDADATTTIRCAAEFLKCSPPL